MLYVNPLATPEAARINGVEKAAQREQLAVRELEHFFVFQLLKEMRKTVPDDGLFPKDGGTRMQEDMMDDLISGEAAKSGQFGIGNLVRRQFEMQRHYAETALQMTVKETSPPADNQIEIDKTRE